jgi:hypothetical protein
MRYPDALTDPDTGKLISGAEVADVEFTAFTSTANSITARLIVRRIRDRNHPDALFPVWRCHPSVVKWVGPLVRPPTTNPPGARSGATLTPVFHQQHRANRTTDLTHRGHPIIETVFSDLIDGPLAHLPSGRFAANSAWAICAAMAHNLLRATATLSGRPHALARGATLRRQLINVPARLVKPQRRPVLRLPAHWPYAQPWLNLWNNIFHVIHAPPAAA